MDSVNGTVGLCLSMWSLGQEDLVPAHEICGISNDGEIDIHLVIRVALVMKFLRDVSDENRLCFQLCQKCIDDAVIDARSWRRISTRFNTSRTSRIIGSLTKSDMSPLKNSRSALRAGLFRL